MAFRSSGNNFSPKRYKQPKRTPCRHIDFIEVPIPCQSTMLFQYRLFDLCSLLFLKAGFWSLFEFSHIQPSAAPRTHSSGSYWLSLHDSTLGFRSRNRQHAISMADGEHTALPHSTHRHADGLQTLEASRHDSRVGHVQQGRVEYVQSYCEYGPTLL